MQALESRAQKTIRSCCRDLVDVINPETSAAADAHRSRHGEANLAPILMTVELNFPRRIGFAHRSVPDFLNREDVRKAAQSFLDTLDEHGIMSQVVLAELRCTDNFFSHPLYCVDSLKCVFDQNLRAVESIFSKRYLTAVDEPD
jgi:hypothetical protein